MNINFYVSQLEKLVENLSKNNDKQLLHYSFGQPASAKQIESIRKEFFYGRKSSLLDLYSKINGFQIIWNYVQNIEEDVEIDPIIFLKRNVKFDGVINFLPLEIAFDKEIWKETIWFETDSKRETIFLGDTTSNNLIKKKLIPIDFFSVDTSVAMYIKPGFEYFFILQDYHIDYEDSYVTTFEDYLKFTLDVEGASPYRYKAFNQLNGYKNPILNSEQLLDRLK